MFFHPALLKQSVGLPMFSITRDPIMDLISSVKYAENGLGGRNPNQGKGKSARKETRNDAAVNTDAPVAADRLSAERDTLRGRKVDTTA